MEKTRGKREALHGRLDRIEQAVSQIKAPACFAGEFYGPREQIGFVGRRPEGSTICLSTIWLARYISVNHSTEVCL